MKASYEVLKETIAIKGAKAIAAEMNLSTPMVYKWCQLSSDEGSGARNPLDNTLFICQQTGDSAPVDWLCEQLNSYRVNNYKSEHPVAENLPENLQSIIKEFSDLLSTASTSFEKGNDITRKEADQIRKEWQELKSIGESFVAACEQGAFVQKNRAPAPTQQP